MKPISRPEESFILYGIEVNKNSLLEKICQTIHELEETQQGVCEELQNIEELIKENGEKIYTEPKKRKNQKCSVCKKIIKGEWVCNGKYFCIKCKDKDTKDKIEKYIAGINEELYYTNQKDI